LLRRITPAVAAGIARQQWRARIETTLARVPIEGRKASPASNGGRGLKHRADGRHGGQSGASPASNGGRGLKQAGIDVLIAAAKASPASNGGRGLKLPLPHGRHLDGEHRPPAMAGAD